MAQSPCWWGDSLLPWGVNPLASLEKRSLPHQTDGYFLYCDTSSCAKGLPEIKSADTKIIWKLPESAKFIAIRTLSPTMYTCHNRDNLSTTAAASPLCLQGKWRPQWRLTPTQWRNIQLNTWNTDEGCLDGVDRTIFPMNPRARTIKTVKSMASTRQQNFFECCLDIIYIQARPLPCLTSVL